MHKNNKSYPEHQPDILLFKWQTPSHIQLLIYKKKRANKCFALESERKNEEKNITVLLIIHTYICNVAPERISPPWKTSLHNFTYFSYFGYICFSLSPSSFFSFSFRYSWTVYETWERKKRIQINFINWRKRVPPGWQQPVKHIDRHCLWNNIVYLETVYIFIFNLRTLAAPTTATSSSACEKKSAIKINLCKEFLIAFNETNE